MRDSGPSNEAGEGDVDSLQYCGAVADAAGSLESLFDLLLELVETDTEGFARLGGRGLEPGIGDQLEASLLAAEPVKPEGLLRLGVCEGGCLLADLIGEGREGGIEGGRVVAGQLGDGLGHGSSYRINVSPGPGCRFYLRWLQ